METLMGGLSWYYVFENQYYRMSKPRAMLENPCNWLFQWILYFVSLIRSGHILHHWCPDALNQCGNRQGNPGVPTTPDSGHAGHSFMTGVNEVALAFMQSQPLSFPFRRLRP
jgi:hypothetical protein